MTAKSRVHAARSHLPAMRVFLLLALSVSGTWLLNYLRAVNELRLADFFNGGGIDQTKLFHGNIAIEVFDATTVIFGSLVFVAAGVIPAITLLRRVDAARSDIAQIVWAVLIIGLLLLNHWIPIIDESY